ncbi:helix-turn-helix domain-containing protein [Marinococcus halophilus]|uniref:HTH cro/C1-type domain-containing protein n=1 Tax=Marinococcus halophilus TaxID=1371 RepID=A0A510YAC1_MARHA|nr:helix-turn-helix transcriptional regulator [Marinococcus halophilus]GEK60342.1 hypothetical protein MHA01_32470 [Marinococcus halophilus]
MKMSWQYYYTVRKRAHIDQLKREVWTAEHIKIKRRMQGLSQRELAEAVGASARTIRLIESGMTTPHEDLLRTIAQILSIHFPQKRSNEETRWSK